LLLYCGIYDNIRDCIGYFESTHSSESLEQPSLLRFLYYFEAIFENKIKSPAVRRFKKLTLTGFPTNSGLGQTGLSKPYFEIYDMKNSMLVYDNKDNKEQVKFYPKHKGSQIVLSLDSTLNVYGSISIKFKTKGAFSSVDLFYVTLNTAFIPENGIVSFNRYQISPETLQADTKKYDDDFSLQIDFDHYCKTCRSSATLADAICDKCSKYMSDEV
jgi:hypothetical protein